jgi:hypothetical protein
VTTFDTDCIGEGLFCDDTEIGAACFACLVSQPSDTTWGPLLQYKGIWALNLGGCYALKGASTTCSQGTQEQSQCENAACDSSCSGSSETKFGDCITSADNGVCSGYQESATCASTTIESACQGASAANWTFDTALKAMGKIFCE